MSLLTPQTLPAKVYKWDDVGAPALNGTANSLINIFEKCLVDGYGSKVGAGWTKAFDATGVKVFRPEISAYKDFFLRLSSDSGTRMIAQVYLDMTDANTGILKLETPNPFRYAESNRTGKWILIATTRGVWFFCESRNTASVDKTGAWFFCGDTSQTISGERGVYLNSAGGEFQSGYHASMLGYYGGGSDTPSSYDLGKLMYGLDDSVATVRLSAAVNGGVALTDHDHVSSVYTFANKEMFIIPALFAPLSGAKYSNFETKDIQVEGKMFSSVVFGAAGNSDTNYYIATDEWVY